ncbi:unnamed protein product [Rotaria sp. Silwood1]|nr:unnamed protein product [Rotaria sp. Silwood1]CAF1459012.1 unnamed protein product [Rotaria sp. Silwood1]CAF3597441.1 unnamed protein product [Rotaria sp. Silwood1]CAF3679818.1 unnamed protein product [Rotaria sp. Silwood1]CAF4787264.1 unnamed protein product [Rotaria sp. Silwood1]
MHVYGNGNKRIFIPSKFFQQIWSKDLEYPIDHSDQSDISSTVEEKPMDIDRPKRNCLAFALKKQHRSSKWMCW